MDTDETTQVMYSTSEVAKRLHIGPAMVRKWSLAYEKVTGDTIKLRSKRDGRYFTAGQLGTISTAKTLVDSEGVKVETALKMVMGESQLAATVMTDELDSLHTSQALEAILEKHDVTNRLLLEEIRGLRQDLKARELPVTKRESSDSYLSGLSRYLRNVISALVEFPTSRRK